MDKPGVKIKKAIDAFAAKTYQLPEHLGESAVAVSHAINALKGQFDTLRLQHDLAGNKKLVSAIDDIRTALTGTLEALSTLTKKPQATFEADAVSVDVMKPLYRVLQMPDVFKSAATGLRHMSKMEEEKDGALSQKITASITLANDLFRDAEQMRTTISAAMERG